MTVPDPNRRRLLRGLAASIGVLGFGACSTTSSGSTVGTGGRPTTMAPLATVTTPPAESDAPVATTTSAAESTSTTSTTGAPPSAISIAAICGEAWGALPVAGEFTNHTIDRLTVHHTAALLHDDRNAPAHVRQHQRYHIDRGWPDLAYHFIVDGAGHVYRGRPVDAVGDTGTEYDPTGHFLVCAEGNFDEQEIPGAQVAAIVDVLAWASATFGVDPGTITGHRDWASTSCPGDLFYPLIAEGRLEHSVGERLAAGGVVMTDLCGEEGAAAVDAIESGSV